MTLICVKAPATTANMGPGYDCLGMALDVWNTIEIETLPRGEPVVRRRGAEAGVQAPGAAPPPGQEPRQGGGGHREVHDDRRGV